MQGDRASRVAEQIWQSLSNSIRDLRDPRLGFVTVTRVDLSRDLKYARVHVSVLGDEKSRDDSLQALRNASGFLRREIGRNVKLRYNPSLTFHFDHSMEHGARVDQIINELHRGAGECEDQHPESNDSEHDHHRLPGESDS